MNPLTLTLSPTLRAVERGLIIRKSATTPLYQVMIYVQSEELVIKLPDVHYEMIPAFTDTSKLDLTFYILTHHPEKFVLNIEYSTALFEASTIKKIANDFFNAIFRF